MGRRYAGWPVAGVVDGPCAPFGLRRLRRDAAGFSGTSSETAVVEEVTAGVCLACFLRCLNLQLASRSRHHRFRAIGGCVGFWKADQRGKQGRDEEDRLVEAIAEEVDEFAAALLTVEGHTDSPFLGFEWFVDSPVDRASSLGSDIVNYLRSELAVEPEWSTVERNDSDDGAVITLTWFGSILPLVVMTSPPRRTPHGVCVHVRILVPTMRFEDPAVGHHVATTLNSQVATSFTWAFSTQTMTLTAEASLLVAATEHVVTGLTVSVARLRLVALETYSLALHGANHLYQRLREDGTVTFALATTTPPTGEFRRQDAPFAANTAGHIGDYAAQHGNTWPNTPARDLLDRYLATLPAPLSDAFRTTLRLNDKFGAQTGIPDNPTWAVRVPFPEQDQLAFIFAAADEHPTVGHGLMLRLETPYRIAAASVPRLLEMLHRHEVSAFSGTPLLGFWFTWPPGSEKFRAGPDEHTLSFGTFLPSIRSTHVDPADAVGHLFRRARLLREVFGPTQPVPAPPISIDQGGT